MPLNVPGCGNAGLGAGAAGDLATLLHEIGHGYGFTHTPCGAAGTTDANYPDYKPYPSASIGEYGFDVSNGHSPDQRYIRVATGLDYRDAAPVRGMRYGAARENLVVQLQVQQ